jgi:hypothetical protein
VSNGLSCGFPGGAEVGERFEDDGGRPAYQSSVTSTGLGSFKRDGSRSDSGGAEQKHAAETCACGADLSRTKRASTKDSSGKPRTSHKFSHQFCWALAAKFAARHRVWWTAETKSPVCADADKQRGGCRGGRRSSSCSSSCSSFFFRGVGDAVAGEAGR